MSAPNGSPAGCRQLVWPSDGERASLRRLVDHESTSIGEAIVSCASATLRTTGEGR